MRRKAALAALRADFESNRRDLWQLAEEVHIQKAETVRLQAIVDRQDELVMWLWEMIESQEKGPRELETPGARQRTQEVRCAPILTPLAPHSDA